MIALLLTGWCCQVVSPFEMNHKALLSTLAVFLFSTGWALGPAPDSPWPQQGFGPSHTGHGLGRDNGNAIVVVSQAIAAPGVDPDSAPVLDFNGTAYLGSHDGSLYAVTRQGSVLWSFQTGGAILASPVLTDNQEVIVGSSDGTLYGVDANTGQNSFKYHVGGSIFALSMDVKGRIYVSCASDAEGQLVMLQRGSDGSVSSMWNASFPASLKSAATIGRDGSVYISSFDHSVYRLDGDTGQKVWSYETGELIKATPVLDPEELTLFVGSEDSHFYALTTEEGNLKWKFPVMDPVDATATISFDGSMVVVGSLGGKVYALDTAYGRLMWNQTTGGPITTSGVIQGLPGEELVYISSQDRSLYGLRLDSGMAAYAVPIGGSSSIALGGDGRLLLSSAGHFLQIGLSVSQVVSSMQDARRAGINNDYTAVTAKLATVCSYQEELTNSPPQLVEAVNVACEALSNAQNGVDPFGRRFDELVSEACLGCRQSYVDALDFEVYRQRIVESNIMLPLLRAYEAREEKFNDKLADLQSRRDLANLALQAAQEDVNRWNNQINRYLSALQGYGAAITVVETQMQQRHAAIMPALNRTEQIVLQNISDAKTALQKAKDEWDVKHAFGIFSGILKAVVTIVSTAAEFVAEEVTATSPLSALQPLTSSNSAPLELVAAAAASGSSQAFFTRQLRRRSLTDEPEPEPEPGNDKPENPAGWKKYATKLPAGVSGLFDNIYSLWKTCNEECDQCKKIKGQIDQLGREFLDLERLANWTIAVMDLDQVIKKPSLENLKNLPTEIPSLILQDVTLLNITDSLDVWTQEMVADGTPNEEIIAMKVMTSLVQRRIALITSWYQIAMKIADQNGTMTSLQLRTTLLKELLADDNRTAVALSQAEHLIEEQRWAQASYVMQFMSEEFQQFRYWSLNPTELFRPPTDPTADDLLKLQQDLDDEIQSEKENQQGASFAWANFDISVSDEPDFIASLQTTSSATTNIPVPLKTVWVDDTTSRVVANTSYSIVRMMDVRVNLFPQAAVSKGDVQVRLIHGGCSYFLDSQLTPQIFTHQPITYNYKYTNTVHSGITDNMCPEIVACDSSTCPGYINYSPYGDWTVTITSPDVNASAIEKVRFQFKVSYQTGNPPDLMFGKPYPQDVGVQCCNCQLS